MTRTLALLLSSSECPFLNAYYLSYKFICNRKESWSFSTISWICSTFYVGWSKLCGMHHNFPQLLLMLIIESYFAVPSTVCKLKNKAVVGGYNLCFIFVFCSLSTFLLFFIPRCFTPVILALLICFEALCEVFGCYICRLFSINEWVLCLAFLHVWLIGIFMMLPCFRTVPYSWASMVVMLI